MTHSNKQPDFVSQDATEYKTAIDNSVAHLNQTAGQFSAQPSDPPAMSLTIERGVLPDGSVVGPSVVSGIGAPGAGQKQKHWILYNPQSRIFERKFSTAVDEAAEITPPFMASSWAKICSFVLRGGDTAITGNMIEDLRTSIPEAFIEVKQNESWVSFVDINGATRLKYSHITGSVEAYINTAGSSPGFIVRDQSGAELMKLDKDGNLYLKGEVHQQV